MKAESALNFYIYPIMIDCSPPHYIFADNALNATDIFRTTIIKYGAIRYKRTNCVADIYYLVLSYYYTSVFI